MEEDFKVKDGSILIKAKNTDSENLSVSVESTLEEVDIVTVLCCLISRMMNLEPNNMMEALLGAKVKNTCKKGKCCLDTGGDDDVDAKEVDKIVDEILEQLFPIHAN